jgi:hypothetical protein
METVLSVLFIMVFVCAALARKERTTNKFPFALTKGKGLGDEVTGAHGNEIF